MVAGLSSTSIKRLSNAQGPRVQIPLTQWIRMMTDFRMRMFASILINCIGDCCANLIPGNINTRFYFTKFTTHKPLRWIGSI